MLLHIYAVVPKTKEREQLLAMLKKHHVPFEEVGTKVSVDMRCLSYKTVEQLVECFERFESDERGVSVLGTPEEVPYDP